MEYRNCNLILGISFKLCLEELLETYERFRIVTPNTQILNLGPNNKETQMLPTPPQNFTDRNLFYVTQTGKLSGYFDWEMGFIFGVRISKWAREFILSQVVETGCGAQTAS